MNSVCKDLYSDLCCETKWINLSGAILDFGVCFYGGSELLKHLSKCLLQMRKMQKIWFFYDGGKFRRQCVNGIDTTWGRIYFLTCQKIGQEFLTDCPRIFRVKMTDLSLVTYAGLLQTFYPLKPYPSTFDFKSIKSNQLIMDKTRTPLYTFSFSIIRWTDVAYVTIQKDLLLFSSYHNFQLHDGQYLPGRQQWALFTWASRQ